MMMMMIKAHQGITENSHIGHEAYASESAYVKVQNIYFGK
jgi:hypothetical protein